MSAKKRTKLMISGYRRGEMAYWSASSPRAAVKLATAKAVQGWDVRVVGRGKKPPMTCAPVVKGKKLVASCKMTKAFKRQVKR